MSEKKRVRFDDTKKQENYYEKPKIEEDDDEVEDSYDEDDGSDEDGSRRDDSNKKHQIDSDEEEEGRKDRYKVLKRAVLEDIGQEAKTAEFDENIKLTPFNMKEELEEGDFDTDGYYHWKRDKDDVKDAWLDNIDWTNANSFKQFKKQKYELNEAEAYEAVDMEKSTEEAEAADENESDDGEESDDEGLSISAQVKTKNIQNELFKQILIYLKPNENILTAIKRLGKSNANKPSSSLSASQRWGKKKNVAQATTATPEDETKAKEDAVALEKLTSLANKFIDMGYYDIYEETFEKINFKLNSGENDTKAKAADDFDMFADDVDDNKIKAKSDVKQQQDNSVAEDKQIKWFYKLTNTEDEKLNGPFTSDQMLEMSSNGKFSDSGVWCRKADDVDSNFYNSRRIDFELYT